MSKRWILLITLLGILSGGFSTFAQADTDFLWLEEVIDAQMSEQRVAGLAIALVQGDEVIYQRGFGVRNTETEDPITTDTLFQIGSTTKPLTTIAILQQVEAGTLDLDTPIINYLPAFAVDDNITLRHLLSHSAGLNDEANPYGSLSPDALQQAVLAFGKEAQFAPVGTLQSYSNAGFNVAGAVLESVVDGYYADHMKTVFSQFKMTRTTFDPTLAMTYPLAVGYQPGLFGNNAVRPMSANMAEAPSGIAYSTVEDLAYLVEFFLNEGVVDGTPIISPQLFATMTTPAEVRLGTEIPYGLGVIIDEHFGVPTWGHDGKIDGYTAVLRTWHTQDLGVVILANNIAFSGAPIERAIAENLLGLSATPDTPAEFTAPADLSPYVGTYSINNPQGGAMFEAEISVNGEYLRAQITGQPTLELRPVAPDTFEAYLFGSSVGARVMFLRDDSGAVRYISAAFRAGAKQ